MKEPGYIYIMVNPSIEGRVKIGKTTRDSRLRAKELSQATGVATPFYVAFSVEVDDCHSAEKYVHSILKSKGFDRSPNREFFEIPLRDAIEVLIRAEKEFPKQTRTLPDVKQAAPLSSDINADAELFSRQLGIATFKKAVSAYYGFGDELEDKREALRLFNEAKALNFAPAYNALSEYFLREANEVNNSAARELRGKALDVLKEGT
ncbi:MAG: GIY-YIG nuclease family protein, partial [Verrucomicrobiota bacterium]